MSSTAAQLWEKVLEGIRSEVDEQSYETWLASAKGVSLSTDFLYIEVESDFAANYIYRNMKDQLEAVLKKTVNNKSVGIKCIVAEGQAPRPQHAESPAPSTLRPPDHSRKRVSGATPVQTLESTLNPKYTFSEFVVGKSNQFAHAAAKGVAEKPAQIYNPLFIYGGVGLGKTHLMQAIGHSVKEQQPQSKVYYVQAENFMNEMIQSIQHGNIMDFRNKHRNLDVLLIDDIQFIAGKESTQEEFFHTFNSLHGAHKQIIVTSDRPPKEIPTLEARLVSRFEWGLITDIQPPDFETRVAILRKKAESHSLEIPNNVMHFIAHNIDSNIRELEGSLIRLIAYAQIKDLPITIEMAGEVLKDMMGEGNHTITIDIIQRVVGDYFNVSMADLISSKRHSHLARSRQIAMYLSREYTNASLIEIGKNFGDRDHATVIHAHKKIKKELSKETETAKDIKELTTILQEWLNQK
ncbi:MAG: chromosomal replication initiator protein DnaA [Gemmatimonadetes bacterium]|nr:MAG: chromosomal replication initiator protein DnaA [Gemmatimonadota bacterium]